MSEFETVLAAACSYLASRLWLDKRSMPGAYDAAEMELRREILDSAVLDYVKRFQIVKPEDVARGAKLPEDELAYFAAAAEDES